MLRYRPQWAVRKVAQRRRVFTVKEISSVGIYHYWLGILQCVMHESLHFTFHDSSKKKKNCWTSSVRMFLCDSRLIPTINTGTVSSFQYSSLTRNRTHLLSTIVAVCDVPIIILYVSNVILRTL